ncbi:hypothetical protein [Methanobrevibacter filiformis]|uniref:Uncharacterized protein n=1 Tax=Methanobrevibacter filiformis TaxID=55758 RepID=A0A166C0P6_9EURY|nr:hypothetical protein [Methanobrevibacter filiformis]KZX14010.1 hypothetical protein MBFIL_09750 [Methanobrevibacter filiformis]
MTFNMIKIQSDLFKHLSKIAKTTGTTEKELAEHFIKKGIAENENNEQKLEKLRINDKLPRFGNGVPKAMEELSGFIETDNVVDVEKLKDQIHLDGI